MRKLISILTIYLFPMLGYTQFTDRVWCFGDSAGIDFTNINSPTTFSSNLRAKGSCASISDNNSNLLFYSFTRSGLLGETTFVMDSSHFLMMNGDNIAGCCWYNELMIIPIPNEIENFYLISNATVTAGGISGLHYSIIDISQNGGLGAVIQKNILISSEVFVDAMIGIKHGNGRDWWLILHTWNGTNTFYKYLISPTGITLHATQNIGQNFNLDACRFSYSYITSKFISVTAQGQIQLLTFDRCTGNFYNPVIIENPSLFSKVYIGCSISPNGNVAYVSNTNNIFGDSLTLYQYDLTSSNIAQSRQTIYKQPVPASGGLHALGPDGKIYISCLYEYGYPYADTIHNIYSDNLSVINYPDSLGPACDFQPFSFNLGAGRAYWGLPNNPNYEAGAWIGSQCDTLTGIDESFSEQEPGMNVYYHPGYEILFVNANNLSGKNYHMTIYDLKGKVIKNEVGLLNSGLYTSDVDFMDKASGMYVVTIRTEKENMIRKFVKK